MRENTQSTSKTQKQYYDNRRKPIKFAENQLVWLYWPKPPVRIRFKKLQRLWTGPWKILSFKSPLVIELQKVGKHRKQIVHVDRLAPCNTPIDAVESPSSATTVENVENLSDSSPHESSHVESHSESQAADESSVNQRPVRYKRRPKALEPYILT